MKVVIIGAGPAGISAAYTLCSHGHEVELFEASDSVGGMSKSIELWGQTVDLGPHRFFSKEKHVNHFFKEVLQEDYVLLNRHTTIFYQNKFFNYPLKIGNVLSKLSMGQIVGVLWAYFIQKLNPIKNPSTFEEWVTNRFGKKLFNIFFKNYSEKLWGIPCSEIDADWAAQRMKSLSLWQAVINALFIDRKKKHKTLIDQFVYPTNGTGALYEKAAEMIKSKGGKIYFNSAVQKVAFDKDVATGLIIKDGKEHKADHIISTMPLTHLIKGIDDVPNNVAEASARLMFRNTILVYLEVDHPKLFTENWIYIHSPELKHGRITNFRNWSEKLYAGKNTSIVCLEFWAFEEDDVWSAKDEVLIEQAKTEFDSLGLNKDNSSILNADVVRIPRCYPVYKKGYQEHLGIIQTYLDKLNGITAIGRYGAFKYNNQDHSILMGILAAEKLSGKTDVDLWDINTDTEYQEEGKIKDILA